MRIAADLRFPKLGRAPQIVALLLVVGLVGAMAIEPTRQLIDQRRRISAAAAELRAAQEGNLALQAQIDRLNNNDYIEQRARAQIGLVRPGETTFVVMPPSGQQQASEEKKKRVKARAEPPPAPTFFESVIHFIVGL